MKYDPSKSFGYPVLRPESDDYLRSAFQLDIDFDIDKNDPSKFSIAYSFHCGVRELNEFIRQRNASYWIRVFCRSTFFTKMQRVDQSGRLSVLGSDLRDVIEISGYVIGETNSTFQSSKINPEFGVDHFDVTRGQVLAQSSPASYVVEKEIWKHISSIFEYRVPPDQELKDGEFYIDLDGDSGFVEIFANNEQCKRFKEFEKSSEGRILLINSVFFPTVAQMISTVQERRETVLEKKWAKVLTAQAAARNIDILKGKVFICAQRLLDRPLSQLGVAFLDK